MNLSEKGARVAKGPAGFLVVLLILACTAVFAGEVGREVSETAADERSAALPSAFSPELDCGYHSPEKWQAERRAAVERGEIAYPAGRAIPKVAPRRQPATTDPEPCLTGGQIFLYEDTDEILLTSLSFGQLEDLMTEAANALIATHGDNYDFMAYWLNFQPDHTIGAAFYSGIENDVTGLGQGTFNARSFIGLAGDNVEGYIMMWNINSGFWQPGTGPDADFARLALAQEYEHRFGMFLPGLPGGRQLQGGGGCGRGGHWNFRVDGQGSGMEIREWVGENPATVMGGSISFNTDIGGVFSYADLYLMGYVSPDEMDSGNRELRYMDEYCS